MPKKRISELSLALLNPSTRNFSGQKLPRKTDFFLKAKDLFLRSYFDIKSIKLCLRQNLT